MTRLLAGVAFVVALASTQASATPLTLSYSGVFGPGSSLDGMAFGTETPFTFDATFDSTGGSTSVDGLGVFDTIVTFHIDGTAYVSDPGGDVNVYLFGYDHPSSVHIVGLTTTSIESGFVGWFGVATPPFDGDSPVPSRLYRFGLATSSLPFIIPLAGGGALVINDLVSLGTTAEIVATPVAEPASLLLLGTGGVGIGMLARIRRRKHE